MTTKEIQDAFETWLLIGGLSACGALACAYMLVRETKWFNDFFSEGD